MTFGREVHQDQGENLWLRIHEDATWEFVNDQDDVIEYGTLWVDENGVTLHFDGSGDTLQLDCTVSGDLIDSVNGGTLLPVEGIQSSEPYFTRNGLCLLYTSHLYRRHDRSAAGTTAGVSGGHGACR